MVMGFVGKFELGLILKSDLSWVSFKQDMKIVAGNSGLKFAQSILEGTVDFWQARQPLWQPLCRPPTTAAF